MAWNAANPRGSISREKASRSRKASGAVPAFNPTAIRCIDD
jgi:hypothetical protein